MAEARDRWASRPAFIMAAVGSAIGLGNVWRFPGIAFQNGGGAFFIPYFIALLTAGIPLMIVEYGIGSRYQGSAAKSYKRLGKNYEWIGWWAVLIGGVISVYYCVILAWSWEYCWHLLKGVFTGGLPWGKTDAENFFKNTVSGHAEASATKAGGFNFGAMLGLAATWIVVYLSIAKGVLRVGKVVMITVPLPLVLLVLLALRGLSLGGATDGLAYYLTPDWSKLAEVDTWREAYSQVFFSLSVGWGILIAYASYLPKKTDVVNNAYMTSFANCGFSFLAGFAVFSTMGYLGVAMNTPLPDLQTTSFGLAFTSYPTAVANFEVAGWLQALIGLGFFLMLLTLGVDSAFSIVEAMSTAVYDKFRITREKLTLMLCVGGFLLGLVYCFRAGLYWLDITDHYMNNYGLTLVALTQCLLVAWIMPKKKLDDMQREINERSELTIGRFWRFSLRFVTPAVLIVVFIWTIKGLFEDGMYGGKKYAGVPTVVFGVAPALLVVALALFLMKTKGAGDVEEE